MHVCARCKGRAVQQRVLRGQATRSFMGKLVLSDYSDLGGGGLHCPNCSRDMKDVTAQADNHHLLMHVCPSCELVWVDHDDVRRMISASQARARPPAAARPDQGKSLEQMLKVAKAVDEEGLAGPRKPAALKPPAQRLPTPPARAGSQQPPPPPLPPGRVVRPGTPPTAAARPVAARLPEVVRPPSRGPSPAGQRGSQQHRPPAPPLTPPRPPTPVAPAAAVAVAPRVAAPAPLPADDDPGWWAYVPAILGMPVELGTDRLETKPYLTWIVSAVMAVLTAQLLMSGQLARVIHEWGFVPAEWSRQQGLTILASMFLHAGVFHVASNLYFLMIFGDNVEDHLGPLRFLLLLVAAHVGGLALHSLLAPGGRVPLVGASAAISGVIGYYAVLFPHARLALFLYFRWMKLSALGMLVLFVVLQLLGAYAQMRGLNRVSALGHIGGLAVGVTCGLVARLRRG